MSSADAEFLADDLESLRTGTLSASEFRAKWQPGPVSEVVDVIWQNLEHYLADSDIRDRDPAYRGMQEAEMVKLIRLLRAGTPAEGLAVINFLGVS